MQTFVEESLKHASFPQVVATQLIRPLRGSSRSVLAVAEDSHLYIVKFANNPGGPNVLANEVLGQLLCDALDLPAARGAFVYVPQLLLNEMEGFWSETSSSRFRPQAGVHYGSRYIGSLDGSSQLFDIVPTALLHRIANRSDLLGMLILDIWANHQDHRQSVFSVAKFNRKITATFIDHGDMFGGPQNLFDDTRCKAFTLNPAIYEGLFDPHMIEHWKDRIYEAAPAILLEPFDYVPKTWLDNNHKFVRTILITRLAELERLVEPFSTILRDLQSRALKTAQKLD